MKLNDLLLARQAIETLSEIGDSNYDEICNSLIGICFSEEEVGQILLSLED